MAYPKEKDSIFAGKEKTENETFAELGLNFLRKNKYGFDVFSQKGKLFVKLEPFVFSDEKSWRHRFKNKIHNGN